MGIQVNKEAVSGIRAMLKYSIIRYSVAAAIVIGALTGGLYLIKDTPVLDAFKRDDTKLNDIISAVQNLSVKIDDTAMQHRFNKLEQQLKSIEQLTIVSAIFNENIPAVYRAMAFERAKELKMNHKIRKWYIDFLLKNPDAAWQDNKTPATANADIYYVLDSNGNLVPLKTGEKP